MCGELGLPMCIQTGPIGLPQVHGAGETFPNVAIILDHLGRPEVPTARRMQAAQSLFDLAPICKHLPEAHAAHFRRREEGKGERRDVLPTRGRGVRRQAHGLGLELSRPRPARSAEILGDGCRRVWPALSEEDREWIFGKTAQKLYPALSCRHEIAKCSP